MNGPVSTVDSKWPQPLALDDLLAKPAPPPAMIIDGWLPAGYATVFAGHGGSGKSSVAFHAGVCLATGRPWFGNACRHRKTLYVSCEDRTDALHWRLKHICDHENLGPDDLGDLHIIELVGYDATLFRGSASAGLPTTQAYNELRSLIDRLGIEVLIIDGVADTFAGNENDRGDVKRFMNAMLALVGSKGAVLLIAHINKANAGQNGRSREAYSGSTGWHNGPRARWSLQPSGDDDAGKTTLSCDKFQFGRAGRRIHLDWKDDAGLFLPVQRSATNNDARDDAERAGIVRALAAVLDDGDYVPAATTGSRTAYHVLSATPEFPETLKPKSRPKVTRFWTHVEALRRMGEIQEDSIRRKNRHHTAVLTLKATDDAAASYASDACEESDPASDARCPAPNAPHAAGGTRGSARAQAGDDPRAYREAKGR